MWYTFYVVGTIYKQQLLVCTVTTTGTSLVVNYHMFCSLQVINSVAFSIISYIGLGISLACLLLTIIFFLSLG